MRSDSKIPAIGTIVNNREYIGGLESRYSGGHKRNYITVKCIKCGLKRQIEAKGFWKYGCKCNQLKSIKTKHGFQSRENPKLHRFYNIYNGIKTRCKGTAGKEARKRYYDKGIKCEWETFEQFRDDMYESYVDHVNKYGEKQTTIDRIDSNGNYSKDNCRWATCTEQNKNRGVTNHIIIDGKDYTAWEVAEETGISREQASWRISAALSGKQTKKGVLKKKSSPYTSIYPPATTPTAGA